MARQILIIDAAATNRIVLKVKLTAAFYDVVQAVTAQEALEVVRKTPPSLILVGGLDEIDVVEMCTRLRGIPAASFCPIMVLAAQPGPHLRLAALQAGASSILDQPCCDALLLAQLRSLLRQHETETELRMRESTHRALGLNEPQAGFPVPGRIGLIAGDRRSFAGRMATLTDVTGHRFDLLRPRDLFDRAPDSPTAKPPDVLVVALPSDKPDAALQLLPDLRARVATRHAGILVLASGEAGATALDLGADDVAPLDIAAEEIALRINRLLLRKRKGDRLRSTVRAGLQAAVTDPLTGLFNRRYALPHLTRIAERATRVGRPFAVMVADLDHFKQINDRFGHAAGDAVLTEVARRLRENLRPVDLLARIGGEEFLVALPDASSHCARVTGQRLCAAVADSPFHIPGQAQSVQITVSIGVTLAPPSIAEDALEAGGPSFQHGAFQPERLLRRADAALYEAKAQGRNQVELSRPAA